MAKVALQDWLKPQALINGGWVPAYDGSCFDVVNPATQQVIAKVAECGAGETAAAIDAASNAQADWARRPAKDKALLLRRWFDAVMAHQEPLARLLTLEQGKSLVEARGEIAYGASYIEWFAEEAKRICRIRSQRRALINVLPKTTCWSCCVHYALEFSQRDVGAQNCTSFGGGLHRGLQACE